jgi:MSHA biogenesis protein MshO
MNVLRAVVGANLFARLRHCRSASLSHRSNANKFAPTCKQHGFTLIEMIVTIVLIGILGVGMSRFIGQSVQGVKDTAERQQLSTIGWITSEKISRELRTALPNSFRLNAGSNCLEFIPTIAGTDYLTVPVVSAASSFEVAPFRNYTLDSSQDRVAVYPFTDVDLYDLGNPGTISSRINSIDPGATTNAWAITLSSSHQFLTDSPTRRLYVVRQPVMYCFTGQFVFRFGGYGYQTTMPTPASGTVIASRLANGSFRIMPSTLSRNGVVTFAFEVQGSDGARQFIDQEVQIRNVP